MARLVFFAGAAAVLLAAPASAAWQRVSTPHFVVYADQSPERLRTFAMRLERFDKAVRLARATPEQPASDGNRVTIFMLDDIDDIQKLANMRDRDVAGFYIARGTGSIAFVPARTGATRDDDLGADEIFFHEYAHHLMFQKLDQPYPKWLVEGFAEFYSTASFPADGSVMFGKVPQRRARSILSPLISTEQMVGVLPKSDDPANGGSLYGRGWLLTHYLTFAEARRGQVERYVDAIAAGTAPLDAAKAAFGDLKQLDRELDSYALRKTLSGITVAASQLAVGPIAITPLSAGESAVLPLRMKLERGVRAGTTASYLPALRTVAARYAGEPLVETTLARAEYFERNYDAAEAAADRALARDPRSTEAMLAKGRAVLARARLQPKPDPALVASARALFIAANALDKEDPEPLMLFYRSYPAVRAQPSANAVAALHYAADLAPFDRALRFESALQYLRDGDVARTRQLLASLSFDPHGREIAARAKALLATIDAGAKPVIPAATAPAAD